MRIKYFGVFERPYDTEVYIKNTLESLGHTVDTDKFTDKNLDQLKQAIEDCVDYDFVLLSKGWFLGEAKGLGDFLRTTKTMTVGWFFDLAWGTGREWQIHEHPTFGAKIVCTTDGGHDDRWKENGINHHTLRQGIYLPEAHFGKVQKKYQHDVVFVGSSVHEHEFGWTVRQELLDWLGKTYGDRFAWYGKNDGMRNEELNSLYASAKVVVGDSVYSPNYWSNRVYETIGRGGFLIFPYVPGIENEFTPGEHFVPYHYRDWDGLKMKIDYYIENEAERNKIREAGLKHCAGNHSYRNRCERLIELVKNYKDENKQSAT
jgi:glycosyltransferase involved in cell wall biosynthesis